MAVPGSVCNASQPIRLHAGKATIAAPATLKAGTASVTVSAGNVVYGALTGAGEDESALNVWCTNTGGTADGQLKNSLVVYSTATGSLQVIGSLTAQQPLQDQAKVGHVPYLDGSPNRTIIQPGRISVHELWYGPNDGTCCPSIRATTTWTYAGGAFQPSTAVQN
ncbi:MAG TPA: hypothetical protein VHT75_12010 [Acidimicrobiales bacterium]|nr:hypothetical protein [Acidimicrobiales bacterium]